MKAYKGFKPDLTWDGFQFEIGKTYEVEGKPIYYKNGFTAYGDIDSVFIECGLRNDNIICEVEVLGDIDRDGDSSRVVTNKIKIIRELTVDDLLKFNTTRTLIKAIILDPSIITEDMLRHDDWGVRVTIAELGKNRHRNVLVNDTHFKVRVAVATYGTTKHRDILINDSNVYVRCYVARYGTNKHRNILLNDEHWMVRKYVAKYGTNKQRDILHDDKDCDVVEATRKYYK